MKFRKPSKDAIRSDHLTCSLRNWQRPQAKVGGRYNLHPESEVVSARGEPAPAKL